MTIAEIQQIVKSATGTLKFVRSSAISVWVYVLPTFVATGFIGLGWFKEYAFFWMTIISVGFLGFASTYFYFMFKSPDRLHSERFLLEQKKLEMESKNSGILPVTYTEVTIQGTVEANKGDV